MVARRSEGGGTAAPPRPTPQLWLGKLMVEPMPAHYDAQMISPAARLMVQIGCSTEFNRIVDELLRQILSRSICPLTLLAAAANSSPDEPPPQQIVASLSLYSEAGN